MPDQKEVMPTPRVEDAYINGIESGDIGGWIEFAREDQAIRVQ